MLSMPLQLYWLLFSTSDSGATMQKLEVPTLRYQLILLRNLALLLGVRIPAEMRALAAASADARAG